MKTLLLFLGICCSFGAMAQAPGYFYVRGKITDAVTGLPMQAASVFAQNSSFGTSTDADGLFTLQLPNGGYELVITFTGYQSENKRISSNDEQTHRLELAMKQEEKQMQGVVLQSGNEVKDGWEKHGTFFLDNFIGKTANSKACTLKNPDVLHFYFYKKRNRLKVLATAPLQIENKALGYQIQYTLDSFVFENNTQIGQYTGSPLFVSLTATSVEEEQRWNRNRLVAYQGSVLHFMRSVYQHRLNEEGFEVRLIAHQQNGTDTVLKVSNPYGALHYYRDDSAAVVSIQPSQPDVAVIYTKETPEADFFADSGDKPTSIEYSVLSISGDRLLEIEQNGYFFDQNDVNISGYLGWEKVADLVPYDYFPK